MDDVKFGEILLPGDVETETRREKTVRAKFWPKIARVARKVPFARDAVAAYYCATNRPRPRAFAAFSLPRSPISSCPPMWCRMSSRSLAFPMTWPF